MKRSLFPFLLLCSFAFSINAYSQVPSYVPASGLLAWYPFSGNANNAHGSGNNGVVHGSVTYGSNRFGTAGSCYVGSGGASAIDIPGNNFPSGNASRSISAWFKSVLPYAGGYREIFATGSNAAPGRRFGLHCDGTHLGFESTGVTTQSNFTIDSSWHNLTVTYPSGGTGLSSVKVYIDGVLATTSSSGSLSVLNTDTGTIHSVGALFIPAYWGYWYYSWEGSIDDVGVWNRELTACEVAGLYSGTSAVITGPSTVSVGSTITLTDSISGGTWSSSATTIATVGSSTGVVTGMSAGTVAITYTLGGCVVTRLITVAGTCSGTITTIAGNGSTGFSGDGGSATAAVLNAPYAVCGDGAGNVYIADAGNQRIRKVNTSGVISTIAGTGTGGWSGDGGPATAAQLRGSIGIAMDASGNLYLADQNNQRIRKINTSGVISTIAGITSAGYSGDGGAATSAQLNYPTGVAVDGSGNVYIADQYNDRVRKINSSGTITTLAGTGIPGWSGDGGAATAARLNHPCGVAVDGSGNVYIADNVNHRVRKVDPSGIISTIAGNGTAGYGGDGGLSTGATLNSPFGITTDLSNCIYITDHSGNRVRKINATGTISTIAGTGTGAFGGDGGPATAAALSHPAGVFVTSSGTIYLTDLFNERVRKIYSNNSVPLFTGGHLQSLSVCANSAADSINTLLAVVDSDAGQTNTWSIVMSPAHGAATASYTATTTGGVITPTGLYYTPTAGYTGTDTFKIKVIDCSGLPDTTIICVTVNPMPAAITGSSMICIGTPVTLASTVSGGTWSSSSLSVTTIGSSSGIATGVSAGTATITYTMPGGCLRTFPVTVNVQPASITGVFSVCATMTTPLSDASPGGTWSSGSPLIAAIGSASGIVTGVAPGTSVISYMLPTGCHRTATVTVNPQPAAISGVFNICVAASTTLFSVAGGVWSSSAPAIAAIGSGTGVVTGMSTGTAVITYTLPTGCRRTASLTVDPLPSAITGSLSLCVSLTTTLSSATPGGTWSSSALSVAYVDPGTGVVTGIGTGVATISYTLLSGCERTINVTVNPGPTLISGVAAVCVGDSTPLYNGITGGTWSSSNPLAASVDPVSGVYRGVAGGSATITYSMGAGCIATFPITVYPLPLPITGTAQVCPAMTTTLYDATPGGSWSSLSPGIALVGSGTGIVTGLSPGTAIIRYSFGTIISCGITRTVTVNSFPGTITGTPRACPGTTTTLSCPGGGTWLITGSSIATIGSGTGIVTGAAVGTAVVTYTLPTGCSGTTTITVNPLPAAIAGPPGVCVGQSVTVISATTGGTWSRSNANIAIGSSSGIVMGISAGTSVVTYMLPTGCYVTKTLTVNSSPGAITGTLQVCPTNTTTLSNPLPGGNWTSASPAIATIGSTTGVVAGVASGTAVITYSIGAGCAATAIVSVNALPALFTVTGGGGYCVGGTGMHVGLTGSVPGTSYQLYAGTSVEGLPQGGTGAPLDFGILTTGGIYTVVATSGPGCTRTMTGSVAIIVNPLPAPISGPSAVCVGANITLANTGGGTWQSSTPASATIGSTTGVVTGVAIGTTTITYTLPTGCAITTTVTVSTTPTAIVGASTVCAGTATTLSDAVSGGAWSTLSPAITIGSLSGIVAGVTAGTATVTYSLGTGCTVTKTMTVLPSPAAIGGSSQVCVAGSTSLTMTTSGGVWTSGSTSIATVSGTGVVSGVSAGTAVISYTAGGCSSTIVMTVNAVPGAITGPGAVCAGDMSALSVGAGSGGVWTSGSTGVATVGSSSGIVSGIAGGTTIITYSLGTGLTACSVTRTITVNAAPLISGASGVCVGSTSAWSAGAVSGVWSSGAGGIASVSSAGVVTGISTGVAPITFTPTTGCIATKSMTVNTAPGAITGTAQVCVGGATTLSVSSGSGGVWTSGSTVVATVGSISGVVNGVAAGVSTIIYSLGTGCTVAKVVTVNPLPAPITGGAAVCIGSTTALSNPTTGGAWSSVSTGIATVNTLGVVTGIATGTAMISYTIPTGCEVARMMTVNPLPGSISGVNHVCTGAATTLSALPAGGTWSSSNALIAAIGTGTGIVSGVVAGTATITYSLGAGCDVTTIMTVNALPAGITGSSSVCIGGTTTLSTAGSGGVWSSGAGGIATIGPSSGVVAGISGGSAIISYTVPATGCASTHGITVVTVPPITGLTDLCAWGDTVRIFNADPAGIYSSSLVTVLNLGGGTGLVTAFAPGTGYITYTLAGIGCARTIPVTIKTLPGLITGATNLCAGSASTLSNSVGGGVWTAGVTSVATIGSSSGLLSGIGAGSTNIRYTIPNGCKVDTTAYVSIPLVAGTIAGATDLCVGDAATLTMTGGGSGLWSSGTAGIATIGTATGIVSGVSAGTAAISYAVTNVCGTATATRTMTINAIPDAGVITGVDSLCVGSLTTLSNIVPGGVWSTVNGNAVISATGLVTGVAAGMDTVVYTVTSAEGCVAGVAYAVKVKPWGLCGALTSPQPSPQVERGMLRVWPNPAREELHVENAMGCEVRIFNMLGQEMIAASISSKLQILKIDRLTPGIYVVEVVGDFGKESRRLVMGR